MINRFRHLSVKWHTIFWIVLVTTVIMALSTAFTVSESRRENIQQLDARGKMLVDMQASSLGQSMWDLNTENISIALASFQDDPDFRYAVVKDMDEAVVAEVGKFEEDGSDHVFKSPIKYNSDSGDQQLGQLTLYLKEDTLRQKQIDAIWDEVTVFAMLLLAVLATVYLILSYFIISPLSDITGVMGKMASGDFSHVIPMKRFDEFGTMVTAFNTMTKTLARNYRTMEENQKEIVQANELLEKAREDAVQANRTKSAFLANMSHELRTPLNAIIGYSEILMEECQEAQHEAYLGDLERIINSARHLLQLINEILDLSKIEAGKMVISADKIELPKVVREVKTLINPLIRKGNNRLELNVDSDIDVIYTDEMKLRQSLVNLLGNSAKFTQNGIVTLNIHKEIANDNEWVIFAVRDTGIGMTEEQQSRVFDPFTQADESTTRRYGGTGLGLAITKQTCNLLGGDITVKSKVGEGSTFTIRLPYKTEKTPVQA